MASAATAATASPTRRATTSQSRRSFSMPGALRHLGDSAIPERLPRRRSDLATKVAIDARNAPSSTGGRAGGPLRADAGHSKRRSTSISASGVCSPKNSPLTPSTTSRRGRPAGVGDHRPARRHGLQRRDPELLFPGEDERPATRVTSRSSSSSVHPRKRHGRAGAAASAPLGSRATTTSGHAQSRAGVDGDVDALVRGQRRDDEEVVGRPRAGAGRKKSVRTGG